MNFIAICWRGIGTSISSKRFIIDILAKEFLCKLPFSKELGNTVINFIVIRFPIILNNLYLIAEISICCVVNVFFDEFITFGFTSTFRTPKCLYSFWSVYIRFKYVYNNLVGLNYEYFLLL